jgi:hypothetical protein
MDLKGPCLELLTIMNEANSVQQDYLNYQAMSLSLLLKSLRNDYQTQNLQNTGRHESLKKEAKILFKLLSQNVDRVSRSASTQP